MERTYYQWFILFSLFGFVVLNSTASWLFFFLKNYISNFHANGLFVTSFKIASGVHVIARDSFHGHFPVIALNDERIEPFCAWVARLITQIHWGRSCVFASVPSSVLVPEHESWKFTVFVWGWVCNSSSFVFFQDGCKRNHYRLFPFCPSCFY